MEELNYTEQTHVLLFQLPYCSNIIVALTPQIRNGGFAVQRQAT